MKKLGILLAVVLAFATTAWAKEGETNWFQYNLDLQLWDTQRIGGQNFTSVRRAENYFTFTFLPDWKVGLMLDPAKAIHAGKDHSYLQYAYVQWQINKRWMGKIGQFKAPFSEEGLHPSMYLDTIERAQFNLGANGFGDVNKELGAMAQYQDNHILAQFGGFSGDPTNQSTGFGLNEMDARLVFSPDSHFHFGGSLTRGSRHNVDAPLTTREVNNKNGVEFLWENKPWSFETEYVNGTLNVPTADSLGNVLSVTPTTRTGWYAKVDYFVTPKLSLVLRDDALFTNVNLPGNGERDITAGFNYWFQQTPQEVKWQLNYVNRRSFSSTPVPSQWLSSLVLYY